jgi:hypothetical protein
VSRDSEQGSSQQQAVNFRRGPSDCARFTARARGAAGESDEVPSTLTEIRQPLRECVRVLPGSARATCAQARRRAEGSASMATHARSQPAPCSEQRQAVSCGGDRRSAIVGLCCGPSSVLRRASAALGQRGTGASPGASDQRAAPGGQARTQYPGSHTLRPASCCFSSEMCLFHVEHRGYGPEKQAQGGFRRLTQLFFG